MALGISYEEMLRTVGGVLDETHCDRAALEITRQAIVVQTMGRAERQELPEIEQQSHERAQRRGRGTEPSVAAALARFEWVLRVVGTELDREGHPRYSLTVDREHVTVEAAEGSRRVFDRDALAELVRQAIQRRRPAPPGG